jgi:dTMP kinase
MDRRAEHDLAETGVHRVREVLAIPAFRRLWGVTAITAVAEWQSLLALSALATHLTSGYQAQSFALGGVVATKLLPALLLGPLAGALADKLDRRHQMVVCDVLRAGLFLSIPLVGELAWLFVATFLIELCALFWIPAKDASIPNLLRRPDQVETANQLSLVMTYGAAVLVGAGVFSALSKLGPVLSGPEGPAYLALSINGVAYACCALVVGTRIPEISGRAATRRLAGRVAEPGLLTMLRDGVAFFRGTPLVRGLVSGILGAFAAGGAVIACAKLYATSLGGGDAAYGLLFASLFLGLGLGMALAPVAAQRVRHRGLFGLAIVTAGLALVIVALAPHLYAALVGVILVGSGGGVAFLTGLTIIGAQIADEMRGRTIAFVQSLVRLDLLASMAVVPFSVGLVQQRTVVLFGEQATIDGTRPVLLCAGLLAAVVGMIAHRQMDDRLDGSLLRDLRAALSRPQPSRGPE